MGALELSEAGMAAPRVESPLAREMVKLPLMAGGWPSAKNVHGLWDKMTPKVSPIGDITPMGETFGVKAKCLLLYLKQGKRPAPHKGISKF